MTVAALFIDERGPYPGLLGSEYCWDEERDACTYDGPWPVVAHPPCARWCRLAKFVESQWGKAVGDDGGLFASALASVRRWGGVLEHPAWSLAWQAHGLLQPPGRAWQRTLGGEWVCAVSQAAYGHRARKDTWLLYVGHSPPAPVSSAFPEGTAVVASYSSVGGVVTRASVNKLTSLESRATPLPFAEFLVALARGAQHP